MTAIPPTNTANHEATPAEAAYQELVDVHAERVSGLVTMLLGDRAITEAVVTEAFRFVWVELDRGIILGDLEENLYRAALQRAIRRATRSRDLRGHLPPTIADDRQVTAFGVVEQLIPEHRAVVLAVLWGGLDYRMASIATGVSRDRVREVLFGARQEYRSAYNNGIDPPECREVAPALSRRVDGELEANDRDQVESHLASCDNCQATTTTYAELGEKIRGLTVPALNPEVRAVLEAVPLGSPRPTGVRRVLNLAMGPALLVVVLGLGLFVFQQCEEPTIKTGAGRTSDVIYGRRGTEAIVILDAGSGRELGRLPLTGAIGPAGREAYGTAPGCGTGTQGTTIRAADASTLQVRDIGCVDRAVTVLAADDRGGRLLLGDAQGENEQLLVFDVRQGRVVETIAAPPSLTGVYANRVALAPDGSALFSTTAMSDTGLVRFGVAETDLQTLRIAGVAEIPTPCGSDAVLLPTAVDAVYAYQPACGRLHELHPRTGTAPRRLDLGEPATAVSSQEIGQTALAAPLTGDLLYVLVPENRVAIVDRSRFVEIRRLTLDREAYEIAASTDGGMLYVVNRDGSYTVLDAGSGRILLRRSNLGATAILQVNPGD